MEPGHTTKMYPYRTITTSLCSARKLCLSSSTEVHHYGTNQALPTLGAFFMTTKWDIFMVHLIVSEITATGDKKHIPTGYWLRF